MLWTAFPDQFDPTILKHGLDLLQGKLNKKAAALSACNVAGYAAGRFLPDSDTPVLVTFSEAPLPTEAQVREAIEKVKGFGDSPDVGAFPWATIIPLLLAILRQIWPNLPI